MAVSKTDFEILRVEGLILLIWFGNFLGILTQDHAIPCLIFCL